MLRCSFLVADEVVSSAQTPSPWFEVASRREAAPERSVEGMRWFEVEPQTCRWCESDNGVESERVCFGITDLKLIYLGREADHSNSETCLGMCVLFVLCVFGNWSVLNEMVLWILCFLERMREHSFRGATHQGTIVRNLVDPASSHMLVSKIKPCMSQYKLLYGETANGSLKQL